MPSTNFPGDLQILGRLTAAGFTPPAACITDAAIAAAAGIQATKCQQMYLESYAQESATLCTSESRVVHIVQGKTGLVVAFRAGMVAVNSASGAAVDLWKNGVSILAAPVSLDSTIAQGGSIVQVAYGLYSADLVGANLLKGDVLEIVITSLGMVGRPRGVFGQTVLWEDPF